MSTDMNELIRQAARQDRLEAQAAAPQPARSTASSQPRPMDISAGVSGAGMGGTHDPNSNAMRQWTRERGLEPESVMSVLREAVAEKRLGRRAGWR